MSSCTCHTCKGKVKMEEDGQAKVDSPNVLGPRLITAPSYEEEEIKCRTAEN